MSLPRADYDPRRVCVNPCPNFTLGLGKQKRTVGVYLAGALVRPSLSPHPLPIRKWIPNPKLIPYLSLFAYLRVNLWDEHHDYYLACVRPVGLMDTARYVCVCVVHHRQLDLPRCCDPLRARPTSTRDGTGVGARHVCRLDPRNLLSPRNARRQLDRQGQGTRGGRVRRFEGGLEGQAVFVYQFRLDGGWSRWERCECLLLHVFFETPSPPPRVRYMRLTRGLFPPERPDPQVHSKRLSRDVQVLRLL